MHRQHVLPREVAARRRAGGRGTAASSLAAVVGINGMGNLAIVMLRLAPSVKRRLAVSPSRRRRMLSGMFALIFTYLPV